MLTIKVMFEDGLFNNKDQSISRGAKELLYR